MGAKVEFRQPMNYIGLKGDQLIYVEAFDGSMHEAVVVGLP